MNKPKEHLTAELEIGQRLQIGVDRATVRYVGQVQGQSGNWVGLEWDAAARGKHDGSAGGYKYFSCQYSESGGTFVREPKLQQTASVGLTLLEGIQARYQESLTSENAATPADLKPSPLSHPSEAELDGEHDGFDLFGERDVRRHQAQLALLYKANLAGKPISSAGSRCQLAEALPHLRELDLSSTLLATWDHVLDIMTTLPTLEWLNISHARMALPRHGHSHLQPGGGLYPTASVPGELHESIETALSELSVGGMARTTTTTTTTTAVVVVPKGRPAEQRVESMAVEVDVPKHPPTEQRAKGTAAVVSMVAGEDHRPRDWAEDDGDAADDTCLQGRSVPQGRSVLQLPPSQHIAAHMRTLILNDCHMTWDDVIAVEASLPALEELHLCDNSLTALGPPLLTCPATAGRPAHMRQLFPCLKVLDLASNRLDCWDEIRLLGMLPSLTAVNVSDNSLPDLEQPLDSGSSFKTLRALVCSNNKVACWSSIDKLAQLPQLQELRLTGNLLGASDPPATRSGIIARMGRLSLLNGSIITDTERRDCELHFLRALLTSAGHDARQLAVLQAEYPALDRLRMKYGQMDGIASTSADQSGWGESSGASPLCDDLRRLRFVLVEGDGGGSGADIFDERDGLSSSAASVGGALNSAAFLTGSSYDPTVDYSNDLLRCTVDISGCQKEIVYRSVPGCTDLGGIKFLVARLLGVPRHQQHLLIVAATGASYPAPDSRHVSSLIDAKETDSLKQLRIEDGCDVRCLVKKAPWMEGQLANDLSLIRSLLQPSSDR